MTQEEKAIEIPFGAKDSELLEWVYYIPEGMEAEIKDRKVIIKKAESEDERIRMELIKYFNERRIYAKTWRDLSCEKILAYLEKQKEQKPIPANSVGLKEQKPAEYKAFEEWVEDYWSHNKVNNPYSYNKGDEIQFDHKGFVNFCEAYCYPQNLVLHDTFGYEEGRQTGQNEGVKLVLDNPEKYGLQKEQKPDTRDADDLQFLGFIYDLLNEIEWKDNWAMSKDECLRRLNNYRPQKPAEWSEEDKTMLNNLIWAVHMKSISPLDEMDDRGKYERYEKFLTSLPERFGLKPEREWSEEDEKKILFLERLIRYNVPEGQYGLVDGHKGGFVTKLEAISMLKSLRPQPKQEWSEEDKRILKGIIGKIDHDQTYGVSKVEMLFFLKSLRNMGTNCTLLWKPSEEQMGALQIAAMESKTDFITLTSLLVDLKKL